MNNVVLIGHVSLKPDLSYTPQNQTAVCKFNVAVQRPRKNGQDAGADFVRITVFGRQAETCNQYLDVGRQVAVLGRIQTGSYKNREGVTVYTTDIIADRVEFLGNNPNSNNAGNSRQNGNYGRSGHDETFPVNGAFDDLPESFSADTDDVPWQ